MSMVRVASLIFSLAVLSHLSLPAGAPAQASVWREYARNEQIKARTHLQNSLGIAQRGLQLLQSWQTPDDLKRASAVITDSYVQLNEARDATQRASGNIQRSMNLSGVDPLAANLIGIIDKARETMRVAHSATNEAAAFENGRLTHLATALQHVQQAMQYTQLAVDLSIY